MYQYFVNHTDGPNNMTGLLKTDFNSLIIYLYEINQVTFYNFVLNSHKFSSYRVIRSIGNIDKKYTHTKYELTSFTVQATIGGYWGGIWVGLSPPPLNVKNHTR